MSFPKKVSMPTASANPTGAPRRPGSAGRTRRRNPPATEACVQPVTNSGEKSAPARCGFGHSGPHALPPTSSGEGTKRRTRATRPRRVPAYKRRAAAMPPSTSASCMSARPGGSDHVDTPKPNPRTTTMSPPSAGSWQHCEHKGKLEARLPMNATNACSRGSAHAERTPRPMACWATAPSHG